MIEELLARYCFHDAVAACDPRARVALALAAEEPALAGARARIGVAFGKAALAMARGAPVARGIAVSNVAGDGLGVPPGWQALVAAHPEPDERSVAAGAAVRALVEDATDEDVVIALVSGGASSLIEQPRIGLRLDELRATVRAVMAAGAPIDEINTVRGALSEQKAGQLALGCAARIVTLVASDVIGDPLDVIGSGPTIGPWLAAPGLPVDVGAAAEARRTAALAILGRYRIAAPAILGRAIASRLVTRRDRAQIIAGMTSFADAVHTALGKRGIIARRLEPALAGPVVDVAAMLAAQPGTLVAYGEPTLAVPADHGEGGRAQQLALALARHLRGTRRSALVAGSDGIDGPAPRGRAAPAGAFVDGETWDELRSRGIDPDRALARCDAGSAFDAIGALFVTGPTGVNHADVVVIG